MDTSVSSHVSVVLNFAASLESPGDVKNTAIWAVPPKFGINWLWVQPGQVGILKAS